MPTPASPRWRAAALVGHVAPYAVPPTTRPRGTSGPAPGRAGQAQHAPWIAHPHAGAPCGDPFSSSGLHPVDVRTTAAAADGRSVIAWRRSVPLLHGSHHAASVAYDEHLLLFDEHDTYLIFTQIGAGSSRSCVLRPRGRALAEPARRRCASRPAIPPTPADGLVAARPGVRGPPPFDLSGPTIAITSRSCRGGLVDCAPPPGPPRHRTRLKVLGAPSAGARQPDALPPPPRRSEDRPSSARPRGHRPEPPGWSPARKPVSAGSRGLPRAPLGQPGF